MEYRHHARITVHRQVDVPWNGIAVIDPVVMIPMDSKSTSIVFDGNPATTLTHRSTTVTDEFGTRSCTLVFPGDNRAYAVDESGNTLRELSGITARATEFATLESMPAMLPPTSAYTYCAELSVDEAERIKFDKPVVMWVDNFLGFDAGRAVPLGYYDRDKGVWVPSDNGIVVRLLDTDNDGSVDGLDANGDGLADDLNNDGATSDEVRGLEDPSAYTPGATFWRSEVTHFTPYDCNWPFGPPGDATGPNGEGETDTDEQPTPPLTCESKTNSYVEDRSRVFHEDIPIPGTDMTLHYSANRVNGYISVINVPISGETVPASLKRIEVYLELAGHKLSHTLDPLPDQKVTFTWDGADFRGDAFYGPAKANVKVGFVYDAVYYSSRDDFEQSFAQTGPEVTGIRARQEVIAWRIDEIVVDRDNADVIAKGWTVSPHHRFYPIDMTRIYKGDGNTGVASPSVLNMFAGIITPGYAGDGGPALQAQLNTPAAMAADAAGNIYIADSNNNVIRKVDTDGIITTVAGNGTAGYEGDYGPAILAKLRNPRGVAVDGDGNIYIADTGNHRIRKVSSGGAITTVAGSGLAEYSGDGGPANEAGLNNPESIAVDSAGYLYIADTLNSRIRKVSPSGIIVTVAGNGQAGYSGDGGPAMEAALFRPRGAILDGKGNIIVADTENNRIRRIDISGIITTVAGNGLNAFSGEAVPAIEARLYSPFAVAVDKEGSLYIADTLNNRIRKVNARGIITTLAGDGTIGVKVGVPAKKGWVARPQGIAIDPENRIYFSAYYPNYFACVMETGASELGTLISGEGQAYSDPSGETYIIKNGNQHVATSDSKTHTLLHYFTYDAEGRLVGVYDRAQNKTSIQRDGAGVPLTIVSPYGIRTNLVIDSQNRLVEVRYPDGGYYTFEYSPGGLMTAEIDPMGSRFEHVFNENGRLTDVTDPEGGHYHYNVTESLDGTVRTELITAEGQKTVYLDKVTKSGDFTSLITGPSGAVTDFSKSEDGMTVKKSLPCGSDLLLNYALDPGYGYEYVKSQTLSQPSGLAKTTVEDRLYEDVDNDRVHDKVTTTITVNGKAYVHLTDGTQNQKGPDHPDGTRDHFGI